MSCPIEQVNKKRDASPQRPKPVLRKQPARRVKQEPTPPKPKSKRMQRQHLYLNELWPNLRVGDVILFLGCVKAKHNHQKTCLLDYPWNFARVTEKTEDHAVAIGLNKLPNDVVIPLRLSPTGQITAIDEFKLLKHYESACSGPNYAGQNLSLSSFQFNRIRWWPTLTAPHVRII